MKQCDGERRQTRKEGNWFLMMRNYETKGNTRRKKNSWRRKFKHGQEKESSDVDRNGRVQTWAGKGEFRCGQEWESSNMGRKRRVQMWTGMGEFKHGQEKESSDVDRNGRVQTWAGKGEFRCGQEWENSNMGRKRRVQMWTGMGEFKHGQEKESSDVDRNGRIQTWAGTVYDLHNTISQTCQQNTRNKANKMNSDFCFMSVLCLKLKIKKIIRNGGTNSRQPKMMWYAFSLWRLAAPQQMTCL